MEFGEVELIQDTLQSLLDCVENKDNNTDRLPPSISITPEETTFTMENRDLELGNVDDTQKSVQSLLSSVENEDDQTNRFSTSIFMVPDVLRDLSPCSFNPRVVSFGPLHKEDKNVQAFEGQKVSYLTKLLSRIKVPKEEILESCMLKVYTSMEQIKACYVWTKSYDHAEIAEMMVMDACFILEFIYQYWYYGMNIDEPEFHNMLQADHIKSDLVLLENQIPFFVLDEIFRSTIFKFTQHTSLIQFLCPLICNHNLFEASIHIDHISINTGIHHILSLLHECYKPTDNIRRCSSANITNPSVADLDRAGVNFKPNENPIWPMHMEVELYKLIPCFSLCWSKPTLRMSVLNVSDDTDFILRNLIAYEQSFQTRNHITSYATAIDKLVNTQEDVAKLIDLRVLVNIIGSNEEAANMINKICKDIACNEFYYQQEWKTLNEYCNGYWSIHLVKLKRTYFNSPWNMIALLAGIILFALTMIQTFFAIKPAGSND